MSPSHAARAGTGTSIARAPLHAAREAAVGAMAHLNASGKGAGCELALVFLAGPAALACEQVVRVVAEATGARQVLGCSAEAVLSDGGTLPEGRGVGVMVLRGVHAQVARRGDLARDPAGAARSLARHLMRTEDEAAADPSLLIVADSRSLRSRPFFEALRGELPPATPVLGGGAGVEADSATVFGALSDALAPSADAVAGVCLRGPTLRWGATQSYQPVGALVSVDQVDGEHIIRLDGQPALDLLSARLGGPLSAHFCGVTDHVVLGVPRGAPDGRHHFGLHPITGTDPARRAIRVSPSIPTGTRVSISRRDPTAARIDLQRMLTHLRQGLSAPPSFAIYIEAADRGPNLFQEPGLDARLIAEAFPGTPLIGWRSPRQFVPREGCPDTLLSGGVLALFT